MPRAYRHRTERLTDEELLEVWRWWQERQRIVMMKTKAAELGIHYSTLAYRIKIAQRRFGKRHPFAQSKDAHA